MSAPLVLGREAAHGTVAASFSSAPVNFDSKLRRTNTIPEEQRGGQDVHYANIPGSSYQEWSIADSYVYEDNFGFFLTSAIGLPDAIVVGGETIVWDNTFKFVDDPASLSFKWMQPRRGVQAYQSLWSVVDKLTISFEAGGLLKWTASGIGMSETEVADPTLAFATTRPMSAWEGVVTLFGSTFARLTKGSIAISRNRKPFFTINNSADPIDVSIGNRIVEVNLTCDFNTKTAYDDYKSATPTDALTIVWTDNGITIGVAAHPQFTAKVGSLGWETGEIDTGGDFPLVNLAGKGIYNSGDASSFVAILRSTQNYETEVS